MQKIIVVGVGGTGGYFGGRLAQHFDVTFIARGRTLDVLQKDGLRVDSIHGNFHIPVKAQETYDPADLILICTKATNLQEVASQMKPAIQSSTIIVPLLNGLGAVRHLRKMFGDQVVGGFCRIFSFKQGPGHIKHTGGSSTVEIGEIGKPNSERVQQLAEMFTEAKIKTRVHNEFMVELWKKLIMIGPGSAVGAVTRAPFGVIRSLPGSLKLVKEACEEYCRVARKAGVAIEEGYAEKFMDKVYAGLPEDGTTSMQRDLMNGVAPSELDALLGDVLSLASELDVPMPVSSFLYHSLLPQEQLALAAAGSASSPPSSSSSTTSSAT